jgi:TetR/AcrR family transcriptional regulator
MYDEDSKHSSSKPRSRIRAAHEKAILSQAEMIFAKYGYSGAKLSQIAKEVDISKTNLLYYFPTKQFLYQSVLKNIIDIWLEKLTLFKQGGSEPASKIKSYIIDKLELSRLYPNASKVFANEIINGATTIGDYLQEQLTTTLEEDVKLVNQWIDEGKMDPIDPYHLFFMIWASTQTYADFSAQIQLALKKDKLEKSDFDNAAEFICKVIIKGLGIED